MPQRPARVRVEARYPFPELVKEMVAEDLKSVLLERERIERHV